MNGSQYKDNRATPDRPAEIMNNDPSSGGSSGGFPWVIGLLGIAALVVVIIAMSNNDDQTNTPSINEPPGIGEDALRNENTDDFSPENSNASNLNVANFNSNTPTSQSDLIRVETPNVNQEVRSPLTVEGKARGNWYFEASFPVKLLDAEGNIIAQAPAQAQGEWMTVDFVPFQARLVFTAPTTSSIGFLVLEKDNPSGEPQFDDEIRVPVRFR